eukprot:3419818-Karenia_brevis.AAC.1
MHRKQCLASLHRVHKFLEDFGDDDVFKLPADIKDEIWCSSLLLPVAEGHLRWPISNVISATDATPDSGGTVRGTVGPQISSSMYHASEYAGAHVHLSGAAPATADAPDDEVLEDIVGSVSWEIVA